MGTTIVSPSYLNRRSAWIATGLLILFLTSVAVLWLHLSSDSPRDRTYDVDRLAEWTPFGGTWAGIDGAIENSSEQRGAKLMNGSSRWKNYSVEADVQLLGHNGDAGFIVRGRDEEVGVDSYHGYFAGIRNSDNNLVIGRADFGWSELLTRPIVPQVYAGQWYHLKFLVYDCELVATVKVPDGENITGYIHDPECVPSGRFGLKSYASGGRWKNIQIHPASHADLLAMEGANPPARTTAKPSLNTLTPKALDNYMQPVHQEAKHNQFDFNVQSIASLRLLSPNGPSPVTVRGVVTLVNPVLFLQDASGGIALPGAFYSTPPQIGDQVEAKGYALLQDFAPVLTHATVRSLWPDMPVSPLASTASELATGVDSGTSVEVEGRLERVEPGPGNNIILTLSDDSQSFRAIAALGKMDRSLPALEERSLIRLRGICVLDSEYTGNQTPFAILLPSIGDVQIIRSAPWWNKTHIMMIIACAFAGLIAVQLVLTRIARWRLQAVLAERERLAMEMHDTLAQSFTGIGFQLQAVREGIKNSRTDHGQLDVALDMVRMSHQEAKRSIGALTPKSLGETGLMESLEDAARRLVDGGSISISTTILGDKRVIPLRVFDGLFRIGQEAVSNAIRHSHPSRILIALTFEKDELQLLVKDDGDGFSTDQQYQGFGTRGMEKRAEGIGGSLHIQSSPGAGTSVIVTVPLPVRIARAAWLTQMLERFSERFQ
jgi:signal transduction histidine kinase